MIAVALKSHEIAKAGKFLEVLKACQTTIPRASHCDGQCGIMPFDERAAAASFLILQSPGTPTRSRAGGSTSTAGYIDAVVRLARRSLIGAAEAVDGARNGE